MACLKDTGGHNCFYIKELKTLQQTQLITIIMLNNSRFDSISWLLSKRESMVLAMELDSF